jgi:23S rRNA pseudouridine2457 synthase
MRILRFWKPSQVLTQFTDRQGRATLADFIDVPGVYAAGRLDYDSEGLLLLTDTGLLNARLTDPAPPIRASTWSRWSASRRGRPRRAAAGRPAQRRPDPPGPGGAAAGAARPAPAPGAGALPQERARLLLKLTLTEGRNAGAAHDGGVGHPTLRLVRWAIGPVTLAGLAPGRWRDLTPAEQKALWASVNAAGR